MKHVLISAFVGSDNLGDEAIFESILHNVDFNSATIMATTVNADKTKKHNVVPIPAKSITSIIGAIKKADLVVMGGGGIIQDQSSILNLLYYVFQLGVAKLYKTPVVLAFVGVGPLRFWLSRFLLSRVADTIQYALVRDQTSADLLSSVCGRELKIHVLHDPVLNYPISKIKNFASDSVLVSLRQWYFSVPLLPASMARKLNKKGLKSKKYRQLVDGFARTFDAFLAEHETTRIQFMSFYDSEDQEMTKDVLNAMKHVERCDLPLTDLTVEQYVQAVMSAKILFGMRLHSIILSAVAGKAFAAIDYSPKVRSFAENVEQADAVVSVGSYEGEAFLNLLNKVYSQADSRSRTIASRHTRMASENETGFLMISQTIRELS